MNIKMEVMGSTESKGVQPFRKWLRSTMQKTQGPSTGILNPKMRKSPAKIEAREIGKTGMAREGNDPKNLKEGIRNRKLRQDEDYTRSHDDQWGWDGDDDLLNHHTDENRELTMGPHQLHDPLGDFCNQGDLSNCSTS